MPFFRNQIYQIIIHQTKVLQCKQEYCTSLLRWGVHHVLPQLNSPQASHLLFFVLLWPMDPKCMQWCKQMPNKHWWQFTFKKQECMCFSIKLSSDLTYIIMYRVWQSRCSRLSECCRQAGAEVISKFNSKIHQIWSTNFSQSLYVPLDSKWMQKCYQMSKRHNQTDDIWSLRCTLCMCSLNSINHRLHIYFSLCSHGL